MLRHLLFIGLIFFQFSCAKQRVPAFIFHIKSFESPAGPIWVLGGKPVYGRVLLLHGLTEDHSQFYKNETSLIAESFWKLGWQVLFIDLPYTKDYTSLKGILNFDYRQKWQDRLAQIN